MFVLFKLNCLKLIHLLSGKVRCEGCKKKCTGDILKTENKYFHVKCFVCAGNYCTSGFFLEGGNVYCPKDYHSRFGVRCGLCNQFIEGDVTNFLNKSFHPNCFKCDRCNPLLAFFLVCAACDQCISSGQVLLALDTQWHTWCFKCTVCHCVLHGEYMEKYLQCFLLNQMGYRTAFAITTCSLAGNFHFHPNCARCSRCEAPFLDGQEMYMHGNEIWHPSCNEIRANDTMLPKYSVDFGRHLLYMYLLPEPNMGYLKQPVSPYPPRTQQFHTPQGKLLVCRSWVKKGNISRLTTEALEESSPRPRSPAMNNEEPIELSHYPGGHAPAPGELAPIERDDFPAPPYPYAVDEFKRRLSSNERLDEEDAMDSHSESRILKAEQELNRIKEESSLARVFVQELEVSLNAFRLNVPLHVDPRSSSRTPSANRMPHLKCRYDSPINASPSRYLNRPRPWQWWDKNKALTATIPYAQSKCNKVRTCPIVGSWRLFEACIIDDGFISGSYMMTSASGSYDRYQPAYGSGVLRSSLPDMSKPPKVSFKSHFQQGTHSLMWIDATLRYRNEFEGLFHMTPIEFYKLPEWKRINLKRRAKLF
ncbi:actin binding protein UNC 115 [Trichuris trichiura]|uniref:Actin binding protein UNC 115 n=1 Tax=Trichuris trichiura TaxID=36087 RepID=A0A077YW24_TRITR|nr:actin binding protein UNC 115 [Trichuris trichiura]